MHIPRKRFGQHFLSDQAVIQHIIAALNPKSTDHLIEIGPGQGALTLPLLKQVKELEVVELDRDLIPELKLRTLRVGKLIIHEADALTFDFAACKQDARKLRIFGNLPYNISTPLIFHLLTATSAISDMVFMLQKEVAERLASPPKGEHYGRLSVMVQYHAQVDLLFNVPPQAFFPPPKVESSVIRMTPFTSPPYPVHNYDLFAEIVKTAFGQRRKTLRNSLKRMITDEQWRHIQIASDLRAEDLGVADFVAMSNVLMPPPAD